MQDVRTEANVLAIEQEYNAQKNSQPTHHDEALVAAEKKKQDAAKKAQATPPAGEKASAEKTPATEPAKAPE